MAQDEGTAPDATATHTSLEPRRRPGRPPKPSAKIRKALISFEEQIGTAKKAPSLTVRGDGGVTVDGMTSVARRLLVLAEDARQDVSDVVDALKLQTRAMDKVYHEMDKVKTELGIVKTELATTREEIAVVKRQLADELKHIQRHVHARAFLLAKRHLQTAHGLIATWKEMEGVPSIPRLARRGRDVVASEINAVGTMTTPDTGFVAEDPVLVIQAVHV